MTRPRPKPARRGTYQMSAKDPKSEGLIRVSYCSQIGDGEHGPRQEPANPESAPRQSLQKSQ